MHFTKSLMTPNSSALFSLNHPSRSFKYARGYNVFFLVAVSSFCNVLWSQNASNCYYFHSGTPKSCLSAKIEAVLMIDEAFVTAHQGNIAIARQKAINIFYSMAWGIGQPQSIGLTDRFLFQGYDVVFNHVNFTVDIAPNSWNTGSNTNEWAINIRNYWNSPTKRCISKDMMVLFTGQSLGIDGFHSDCNTGVSICQPGVLGSSHVVVVRNQENYVNTAKTLAHEILHAFGLGHLNEILTDPQTGQSY
ncbi:MAG: hypothetical protein KF734_05580 [Saprospiraceae bacterium]|nr:hypothetical protein [Saprospiraceae bacterium]